MGMSPTSSVAVDADADADVGGSLTGAVDGRAVIVIELCFVFQDIMQL
jgi:hypothetical protein